MAPELPTVNTRASSSAAETARYRPLIVTADADLLDSLLAVAEQAGVVPDVAGDAGSARRTWLAAPLVLVGDDLLDSLLALVMPPRPSLIVVGRDLDDATVWGRASAAGAAHVVFVPDAQPWLLQNLREGAAASFAVATRSTQKRAPVIGCIGGRGGAGATTLAVALALAGVRRGVEPLLVDADPLGGGLDLVLGAEADVGVRWPDLADTRGRIDPGSLSSALPCPSGVALLSWDRGQLLTTSPEAMHAALEAGQRGHGLVVVDLPRHGDDTSAVALQHLTTAFLVVPAELRAASGAARVLAALSVHTDDVRLVVRGPSPGGLDGHDIAESLGIPLAGTMRSQRDVARSLDVGEPPGLRGRGPLAGLANRLLDAVTRELPAA
jgi:secretion/DNA translocation related CpaE-like protein